MTVNLPQRSVKISRCPSLTIKKFSALQALLGLAAVLLFTAVFEHSALDLAVSQHFYITHTGWLIAKSALLPDLIFYDIPKKTLIIFEIYLLMALLQRYVSALAAPPRWLHGLVQKTAWFRVFLPLSLAEMGYVAAAMVCVPLITASLKGVTHVVCPSHLQIFGGEFAYLSIWQNMQAGTDAKCFPAAHASAGFALYAWAFVPSLWQYRWRIATAVTVLAWLMGGYKMLIGDHFLSHTVVSMCLAWTICSALAWLWCRYYDACA